MRYFAVFLLTLAILYSCNPVKRVLKDPVKMNEMASEMIRRGYCANDTTIITSVTDTVFVNDKEDLDTLVFPVGVCNFDTILKSGTRLRFQDGVLYIKEKKQTKTRVITKQVDNFIRDTKYEDILKNDISTYRDTVISFKAIMGAQQDQIVMLDKKLDKTRWYLILVITAVVGTFVWRIYTKFKPL